MRLKVREEHREDLLFVIKSRLRRYPDRDPRTHVIYILQLLGMGSSRLDADESLHQWVMSDQWTKPIVAARVLAAASPGSDLVDFAAYMAAAAGMTTEQAVDMTSRLDKCYQANRLVTKGSNLLN